MRCPRNDLTERIDNILPLILQGRSHTIRWCVYHKCWHPIQGLADREEPA